MQQKKFAVITGGSSGIGLAAAMSLASDGYNIIICGRTSQKVLSASESISRTGALCFGFVADLAEPGGVSQLVLYTQSIFPRLDLLFNNAGTGQALDLERTTDEIWEQTINTNLRATFQCCRDFLPMLRLGRDPLIINNASVAAHRGFPQFAVYSASKGGILSMSRSLREELRPMGIRVSTLSLGATDTDFWKDVEGEWDTARMMKSNDVGKLISHVASLPPSAMLEELVLMPSGGAL